MGLRIEKELTFKGSVKTSEAYVFIEEFHFNKTATTIAVGTRPYFNELDRNNDKSNFHEFGGLKTCYVINITKDDINTGGLFKATYVALASKIAEDLDIDLSKINHLV